MSELALFRTSLRLQLKHFSRVSNIPNSHFAFSTATPSNFVRSLVASDVANGKFGGRVQTRFPPEPSGYLHIGHAKAMCINFGIASDYRGGLYYVAAIAADVKWLGYNWDGDILYASDYFDDLFNFAKALIKSGKAYVCEVSQDEWHKGGHAGTLTTPGVPCKYRNRPIDESLQRFNEMRDGVHPEGSIVLRAKIDLSSSNMHMRDPMNVLFFFTKKSIFFSVLKKNHFRTGSTWKIYPTYDYAHGISDAIEGVTHSLCTLEFEEHRALYNWFVDAVDDDGDVMKRQPEQTEFSRLNISNSITSKRWLRALIDADILSGWDDPRILTIAGMRRRGYPAPAIRGFCNGTGFNRTSEGVVDMKMLESFVRDELDKNAPRAMGVLYPLKVIIENFDDASNENLGGNSATLSVPISKEIFIDRNDFKIEANKKFKRIVRLRGSFIIRCKKVITDKVTGEPIELHCVADENSIGNNPDLKNGPKPKGVVHWVCGSSSVPAEVRLYTAAMEASKLHEYVSFFEPFLNKTSKIVISDCRVETSISQATHGSVLQFEREGYFVIDDDSNSLVLNKTIGLKAGKGFARK
eukprot:GSMAST32.ASY1.ANO1.2262.1 assembled CDS